MKRKTKKPRAHPFDSKGADLIARARQQVEKAHERIIAPTLRLPENLIPGYQIIEEINRGGQGIVYRALRTSTHHEVAIKIMRWSEVSQFDENRRFDQEIAILGRLSHPCIVSLHDGGLIDDYRYFVMDLVSGDRIDRHARSGAVSLRDTLRIFSKVCHGVQAAHLRGVVHRDLKPGNILVDTHGEPHILDFGLAKLIEDEFGHDRARTMMTQTGQFLGSLTWASPEQASGDANKVDVRTDVYALGMTLFHSLTGRYPYEITGSTRNVLQTIAETPPDKPSTFSREIDAELDTIILKCLAKEPQRRYQSAGLLARDIQAYLNGDVIEARRESRLYVLTKTIHRHRAAALATLVLLAASLGYAATLTVLYARATEAESLAQRRTQDAHRALASATETIEFLVGEVSDRLSATTGQTEVRKTILQGAYERLMALSEFETSDIELRQTLGHAYSGMGEIARAQGDFALAKKHFFQSLIKCEQYTEAHPKDVQAQAELSICLVKVGDMEKKLQGFELAETYYLRALKIDESLVAAQPENTHFLDNLLWSYERLGDLARRMGRHKESFRFSDMQCALAKRLLMMEPDKPLRVFGMFCAHAQRFHFARHNSRSKEASEHAAESLIHSERLLAMEREHPYYMLRVAAHLIDVANFYCNQHRYEDALQSARRGLEIGHQLVAADPTVIAHEALLWAGHFQNGIAHSRKPKPNWTAAYEQYVLSRQALERILALTPREPARWSQLVTAYQTESAAALRIGQADEAHRLKQEALGTIRSILYTDMQSPELCGQFALLAEELLPTDPVALHEHLAAAMVTVNRTGGTSATALFELALLQEAAGDPHLARETMQKAASITAPDTTGVYFHIQRHLNPLNPDPADSPATRSLGPTTTHATELGEGRHEN